MDTNEKEVLIENLDQSGRNPNNETRGSINMQENSEIDKFVQDSQTDTMIRKDLMKSSRYSYMAGAHGLTINQGALAILSTCVGGGIVGLPLAMYNLGIPLAIFLQLCVMYSTHLSSYIYLAVKDVVPDHPDSLYELGYMILGRGSIFFLASIFILNAFGLCMIYFIVFGDTAGQLAASFTDGLQLGDEWYTSRYTYSLPLAAILLPICLQKELAELAWVSYVLFISLTLFVIVNFIQLTFDSHFEPHGLSTEVLKPKAEWATISALSVTMLAYSYQQNVFPIFSELKNKTNDEYQKVSGRALPLTGTIYALVGTICCLMFGKGLESSVLLNIGAETHKDDDTKFFWEAYICQISFMLVLMCHIPFIFFSGKEALLIMVDEIMRKSISNALWHKLQTNQHFSMAPENQDVPNPDLPIPGDNNQMSFNEVVRQSEVLSKNQDMKSSAMSRKEGLARSQAIMSHISAAVAQRLAYKDMNYGLYLSISIALYAAIVTVAMVAPSDISSIFDLVSAYSISCVAFLVPAHFFRKAVVKFKADMNDPEIKKKMTISLIFYPLGCVNALLSVTSALLTITGVTSGGH